MKTISVEHICHDHGTTELPQTAFLRAGRAGSAWPQANAADATDTWEVPADSAKCHARLGRLLLWLICFFAAVALGLAASLIVVHIHRAYPHA